MVVQGQIAISSVPSSIFLANWERQTIWKRSALVKNTGSEARQWTGSQFWFCLISYEKMGMSTSPSFKFLICQMALISYPIFYEGFLIYWFKMGGGIYLLFHLFLFNPHLRICFCFYLFKREKKICEGEILIGCLPCAPQLEIEPTTSSLVKELKTIYLSLGKQKLKPQWDTTVYPLRWL